MKKLLLILAVAAGMTACNSEAKKETAKQVGDYESFGEVITPDSAINVNTLVEEMGNAPEYEAKIIGKVVEVCQKKGCWMNIELANGELMRVTFKDYAFFVPTEAEKIVGKEVIMQGVAKFETTSVEELKHYMQDAGEPQEKIDAITEPENSLAFEATGVLVPIAPAPAQEATASVN
jgi:hypothetical protein